MMISENHDSFTLATITNESSVNHRDFISNDMGYSSIHKNLGMKLERDLGFFHKIPFNEMFCFL